MNDISAIPKPSRSIIARLGLAALILLLAAGAIVFACAVNYHLHTEERLTTLVNDRTLIGLDIADAEHLIRNSRSFLMSNGDRVYYFPGVGLGEFELTLAVGDTGVVYDATLRSK